MATLKELLEESHREGEKLKTLLLEKKEELVKGRDERLQAARAELEVLSGRARGLEGEKQELEAQLRLKEAELQRATQSREEAARERDKVERRWVEAEEGLRATVAEREAELSRVRARVDALEEQRMELNSAAGERSQEVVELAKRTRELESELEVDAPDGVSVERLRERVASLLLEKEARERLLRERESEVYALKRRAEDLGQDRERVRTALERTEAALVRYQERSRQLEQNRTGGPDTLTLSQVGESAGCVVAEQEQKQQVQSPEGPEGGAEVQERLQAMQKAVAQLEFQQQRLQDRNAQLEQRVARLRAERAKLRDMLKQLEQERERVLHHLSQSDSTARESSRIQGELPHAEEDEEQLTLLRARVLELEDQVQHLRKTLATDHRERAEFIEESSRNNQWLISLRQDLTDSLAVVSQKPLPSVLQAETQRLDRSLREEEFRLSLSKS
ncbi:hypothetical protein ANANG_G00272940 [Anguilla anguilla]|uniref:Uncharacterized protein n=1 Tax=Anguilla anguilla TaxID=7936 RepID=A0A9D3LR57_ANGAN|nr:hypothetical protein ANANG_G00272940 [Anguilla anguilla]